jgi:hypothetical protein
VEAISAVYVKLPSMKSSQLAAHQKRVLRFPVVVLVGSASLTAHALAAFNLQHKKSEPTFDEWTVLTDDILTSVPTSN